DSSAYWHAGSGIDVDVRRLRSVTRRTSDFARADRGDLRFGHPLLPPQPDFPAAAASKPIARPIDRRERLAAASTSGSLDFIGLDGRVNRGASLAGHSDDARP